MPPAAEPLSSLVVFSQSPAREIALDEWNAHAWRFFATRLTAGARDAGVVVAPEGEPAGERSLRARDRSPEDLALAELAEARTGGGLLLLARRCPTVWIVERQNGDDRLALRLAAILASVLLGPILDARGPAILGVKTARTRFQP